MALSTEQKVGLFFLATLILLAVMVELVEDWRPFEDQYRYVAHFDSSVGLKISDPVRIAGVDVGKVEAIQIEDHHVRVDFYVNRRDSIRQDTVARIRQTNMLGGIFLGLDFGSPSSDILPPGSVVQTAESANIDEFITNLDRNQERVLSPLADLIAESQQPLTDAINRLERIATKIDEGQGSLGKLVNNPSLYDEMTTTSAQLARILTRLEEGEGTFGRLLADPTLYENLKRTMGNLAALTDQINSKEGTLGQLMADSQLYDDARLVVSQLAEITAKINRGEGSLGKLLHDEELYDQVREAMVHINSIAGKIDDGQGTLGRLVNEDDLYRDAKTTLHKVEKSVDGFRDAGPLSALGVVLGTLF